MIPLIILVGVLWAIASSGERARQRELEMPYVPPPLPQTRAPFYVDPNVLPAAPLVPAGIDPLRPTQLVPGQIRRDPGWLG